MANYKPLYIGYNIKYDFYAFATDAKYFMGQCENNLYSLENWSIRKLKPYYSCVLTNYGVFFEKPLLNEKSLQEKHAIVVCSGGLDSTVAAKWALDHYKKITLVHFLYNCRAQEKEQKAIGQLAQKWKCDVQFIPVNLWKDIAKGSRLTDLNAEFAKGDEGVELAKEWVYARNLVFLSMATAYCESINYDDIVLGNNLEEENAYSDNCQEFIKKFNELLPNATNLNKQIKIVEPVGNLMKHEIVKLGLKINAPLDLTWSCYEQGEKPCNTCGPDTMKRIAFEMNGYALSEDHLSWKKIN